jgi:iron complex transport system substrate-binding protein
MKLWKTLPALLLALALTLSLTACAAKPESTPAPAETQSPGETGKNGTVIFKDSTGREVEVPAEIRRIAVTGPLAQTVVFALAPDMLVGLSSAFPESAKGFIDEKYLELPVLGHLYGTKGDLNLETLLDSEPQVVIDIGETGGKVGADMDELSSQTGIPFVHISASIDNMSRTYDMLGELLGRKSEAKALGDYCDEIYRRVTEIAGSVHKVGILYCLGDKGLNVIARGSYHSEAIDLIADNRAVVATPSSKGTGNEVDMEQILNWDPEVIVFAPESIYETVSGDPAWQKLRAISSGRYYEVPNGIHNWMGFPPSVQRYMGMLWLTKILYPEEATYELYGEIQRYYELFYHCELTVEQYNSLMKNSLG